MTRAFQLSNPQGLYDPSGNAYTGIAFGLGWNAGGDRGCGGCGMNL
ncbi:MULTISPECIES: hypothetical protein [unclassified Pseudomonas]|nr:MULTISPECIES: hypothetical protein [unclassified Pseudomonas]